MTDREFDQLLHRFRRTVGGIQTGAEPVWVRDMRALITEVHELRATVDNLVAQNEAA